MGIDGAMVQMISHGLISGALFFCVGVLYDRVHSREIGAYGGVVNTMPIFAAFTVLFALANSGLPATSGFVGEFLVILAQLPRGLLVRVPGRHDADPRRGLHAVAGQARDLRRRSPTTTSRQLTDVNAREFIVLGVLAVAVLRSACGRRRCSMSCAPTRREPACSRSPCRSSERRSMQYDARDVRA